MLPKLKNLKIDELMLVLIVAFIAMVAALYDKPDKPVGEAEKITAMILDNHKASFANNGVIDEDKLREFENIKYGKLKNSLKVRNDFCIYIEDGNGKILLAKGSGKLSKDNLLCRE